MKIKTIFQKSLSALLAASIIASFTTSASLADDVDSIVFKEDYQSIAIGSKPAFGAAGWSGDTSASHGECFIGVVDENGNKSLKMEYVGEGKAITADPLIYRNITVQKGETHVFAVRLKTDDTNRYKQLFLRTSSGEKLELFSFTGARVLTVGSATADLEKGRWYDIRVVLNGSEKIADVYVNGVYSGSRFLTAYDITNMSIRITMMGATGKNARTNVYIDNTAYATENVKIEFEEPEYIAPEDENGNSGNAPAVPDKTNTDLTVFSIDSSKAYISGEMTDTGIMTMVYRGNTFIPLRNIALACGSEAVWNDEDACATFEADGKSIRVSESFIEIDGEVQSLNIMPLKLDSRLYLDLENSKLVSGKEVVADLSGAVYLYTQKPREGEVGAILDSLSFARPQAEQILKDYEAYNPSNSHPRVLIDKARLEKIRHYIANDETFKKWYEPVKLNAEKALKNPVSKYELRDGERLLYVSREAHDNIIYPAFVYLIDGERKYFERAVAEMNAVCEFSDWHPEHFLDTAEMALAVAIGYDWLYDSLSHKQKDKIANAILRIGIDAANEAYEGTAEYSNTVFGAYHNRIGWKNDPSNWGLVCNGGIAAAALALMGDYESEYCADIVEKAFIGIETPMKLYAPDGAWSEGIGYWSYACNYLAYMLSTVKNTLGTNYDYTKVPGILSTANFPIYHTGPKGSFNFGDATESGMSAPILFWFANELGNPSLNDAKFGLMEKFGYNGGIFDILFYNPEMGKSEIEVEKDKKFRVTETAILTNSSASPNANYLAIKGGTVGASHGDLDAGSFVFDSMGERWAIDLGSDSYTLSGYFEWPHRGNYYRKRAEGHSTLVLNPDGGLDQKLGSKAEITHMNADINGACSVVDLSRVYSDDAKSVRRAAALFDGRSKFMIQDEITAENPAEVYWFMQTGKEVKIAPDGKSLVLSDGVDSPNGKRVKMVLQSTDKNAVFTVSPAAALEISPKGEGQTKNHSVSRIQVRSEKVKSLNMQVIFIPYIVAEGCNEDNLPLLMTIDDLLYQRNVSFTENPYATLKDLKVNGKTVDFFDPSVKYYTVDFDTEYNGIPEITASSEYDVKITQPASLSDMAVIEVSDPCGKLGEGRYFVSFAKERRSTEPVLGAKEVKIAGVEASAVAEAQNTPENTIDNDLSTKWSANGSQWIKYDLGSAKKVSSVGIQWLTPTSRIQKYSVELSEDGEKWTKVFGGTSLGTTEGMEYIITDNAEVRYVRISVNGTTAGTWTSLMETKIYSE